MPMMETQRMQRMAMPKRAATLSGIRSGSEGLEWVFEKSQKGTVARSKCQWSSISIENDAISGAMRLECRMMTGRSFEAAPSTTRRCWSTSLESNEILLHLKEHRLYSPRTPQSADYLLVLTCRRDSGQRLQSGSPIPVAFRIRIHHRQTGKIVFNDWIYDPFRPLNAQVGAYAGEQTVSFVDSAHRRSAGNYEGLAVLQGIIHRQEKKHMDVIRLLLVSDIGCCRIYEFSPGLATTAFLTEENYWNTISCDVTRTRDPRPKESWALPSFHLVVPPSAREGELNPYRGFYLRVLIPTAETIRHISFAPFSINALIAVTCTKEPSHLPNSKNDPTASFTRPTSSEAITERVFAINLAHLESKALAPESHDSMIPPFPRAPIIPLNWIQAPKPVPTTITPQGPKIPFDFCAHDNPKLHTGLPHGSPSEEMILTKLIEAQRSHPSMTATDEPATPPLDPSPPDLTTMDRNTSPDGDCLMKENAFRMNTPNIDTNGVNVNYTIESYPSTETMMKWFRSLVDQRFARMQVNENNEAAPYPSHHGILYGINPHWKLSRVSYALSSDWHDHLTCLLAELNSPMDAEEAIKFMFAEKSMKNGKEKEEAPHLDVARLETIDHLLELSGNGICYCIHAFDPNIPKPGITKLSNLRSSSERARMKSIQTGTQAKLIELLNAEAGNYRRKVITLSNLGSHPQDEDPFIKTLPSAKKNHNPTFIESEQDPEWYNCIRERLGEMMALLPKVKPAGHLITDSAHAITSPRPGEATPTNLYDGLCASTRWIWSLTSHAVLGVLDSFEKTSPLEENMALRIGYSLLVVDEALAFGTPSDSTPDPLPSWLLSSIPSFPTFEHLRHISTQSPENDQIRRLLALSNLIEDFVYKLNLVFSGVTAQWTSAERVFNQAIQSHHSQSQPPNLQPTTNTFSPATPMQLIQGGPGNLHHWMTPQSLAHANPAMMGNAYSRHHIQAIHSPTAMPGGHGMHRYLNYPRGSLPPNMPH